MKNPGALDHTQSSKSVAVPATGASQPMHRNKRHTERRLSAYAAAATAAGVSVLATAPVDEADIIFTPANIPITFNRGFRGTLTPLDLNGDGKTDLSFSALSFCPGMLCQTNVRRLTASVPLGNGVSLGPLAQGYRIGRGGNFGSGGILADSTRFKQFPFSSTRTIHSGPPRVRLRPVVL